MKRAHRKSHFWIWVVLAPVIFGTLALAVLQRPAEPINESLPDVIVEGVR